VLYFFCRIVLFRKRTFFREYQTSVLTDFRIGHQKKPYCRNNRA